MTIAANNRAKLDEMHVLKAQELVRALGYGTQQRHSRGPRDSGFTTQVSNAAKLAENCGSMIVFEQWMRYQAGRRVSPWDIKSHDRDFVLIDAVVDYYSQVKTEVDKLLHRCDEHERKKAAMLEMARFMGFLRRAIVAQAAGGVRTQ